MLFRRASFGKDFVATVTAAAILIVSPGSGLFPVPVLAQQQIALAPPPLLSPPELDTLVARVALYPDPLLVQILTAATYPDQVPPAAQWANQYGNLHGDQLARAMQAAQLPWDPSVQSLIPLPPVLNTMAGDMSWTTTLGNQFLEQHDAVMDAVQRMRRRAYDYGYLRTNRAYRVVYTPGYVEIVPVGVGFYYVPTYDPLIVYAPPRPGFFVAGAIGFGLGFAIGAAFAPWGWGHARFGWGSHAVFVNDRPWGRTWANRASYYHPYEARRFAGAPHGGFEGGPRGGFDRPGARAAGRPEGIHAGGPRPGGAPHAAAARPGGFDHPSGSPHAGGPQHAAAPHADGAHHAASPRPGGAPHASAPQGRPSFPQQHAAAPHAAASQGRPSFPQQHAAAPQQHAAAPQHQAPQGRAPQQQQGGHKK